MLAIHDNSGKHVSKVLLSFYLIFLGKVLSFMTLSGDGTIHSIVLFDQMGHLCRTKKSDRNKVEPKLGHYCFRWSDLDI